MYWGMNGVDVFGFVLVYFWMFFVIGFGIFVLMVVMMFFVVGVYWGGVV